jgi:hypothetical protein
MLKKLGKSTEFDTFAFLIGLKLVAVTFIWDYYELLIGTEGLAIYSHPVVQFHHRNLRYGDPGYRDALCERIGAQVVTVQETDTDLTIAFNDQTRFLISFRAEDRIGGGPESLIAQNGMLVVGDSIPDA